MNRIKQIFAAVLITMLSIQSFASEKHALVIAIGAYDISLTGWGPISAENDIPLIMNTLLNLGFEEDNITLITDEDATKEGIVKAFEELYSRISEGDMVVFHYSGHGQQIFDDDGDELDGLDEALVSYDAPRSMSRGYMGEKHVRDDELGIIINRLRLKTGPSGHVLVFLDSCHSGTATRGTAKARGGAPPLVPENWNPNLKEEDKVGFGLNPNQMLDRSQNDKMAKFVLISGSSANELNYETFDDEGSPVGSLSYSIFKAFSAMKPNETYRQVYARIVAEMALKAPIQNPAIEGDIDYEVFGGNYITQAEYFNLTSVKSKNEVEIDGGRLVGIHPGSVIAFAKPGTTSLKDKDVVFIRGEVISARNFNSLVRLEEDYNFESEAAAWAFVQNRAVPDNRLRVYIDENMDDNLRQTITTNITESGIVEIAEDNPDLSLDFQKTRGATVVSVRNPVFDSQIHRSAHRNEEVIVKEVVHSILNYAQGKVIREMNYYDERFDVILELVPASAELEGNTFRNLTDLNLNDFIDANGNISFESGDFAYMKIINYGTSTAYFNIVNIQSNGVVNPIIPEPHDVDGREYVVQPGDSVLLKRTLLRFGPPYGNDVFKIIASDRPFNLTPSLIQQNRATRGAPTNAFESAIGFGTTETNTRGVSTFSAKDQEDRMSTFEVSFSIVEKK
jgi:metacaspase-1